MGLRAVCGILSFRLARVRTTSFCKTRGLRAIGRTWAPGNASKEWCPWAPSPTALLGPVAVLVATRCSLCMRVCPQVPPLHEDASRAGLGPASRPHLPPNTSRKTKHVWHTGLGLRHLNFRATHSNESFTLSFKIFSGT